MDCLFYLKGLPKQDPADQLTWKIGEEVDSYLSSLSYGERTAKRLDGALSEFILVRNINEQEINVIRPDLERLMKSLKIGNLIEVHYKLFAKGLKNDAYVKMEAGGMIRECDLSKPL